MSDEVQLDVLVMREPVRLFLGTWRRCLGIACGLLAVLAAPQGAAGAEEGKPVALELILAVDSSTSVSPSEFALQIGGLARAFREPEIVAAVHGAGEGGIAVALLQWAGTGHQDLAVDWTVVRDAYSARLFADAVDATAREFVGGGTALAEALAFAIPLFDRNGFRGRRRVMFPGTAATTAARRRPPCATGRLPRGSP